MKIYDRLKNCFINSDYYIAINNNSLYILNYKRIEHFDNDLITIKFNNFSIKIYGIDFKMVRKSKYEIEIMGILSKMEITNAA